MQINCQNASFGYDGHIVVSGLTFTVTPGDFFLVVGENGSGKTTFIKGLLGLINPMQGTIQFIPEHEKNRIGYLSQQAAAKQDFPAGVFEIVLTGNLGNKRINPFYSRAEKQKAGEKLQLLGIADLKDRCFRDLSGGQQRRVLLARALCTAENLLVLDEPTAGLDPLISAELYLLLVKICRELGMTIVMATHDSDAINCAAHVLHLHKRQLFFGSVEEYRVSETGKKFFAKMEAENV